MAAVKQKHYTISKTPISGEKQFILNVRSEILKKPLYKRGKKAITAIREMTARSMHTSPKKVKICDALNQLIWSQGKNNPPTRFKVHSIMQNDFALVELQGKDFPKKKEEPKTADKKSLKEKVAEKLATKDEQSKTTETNKELKKENLSLEKKEHAHEAHHAPEKIPNPKDFKADGVGAITQDKKKKLGEQ